MIVIKTKKLILVCECPDTYLYYMSTNVCLMLFLYVKLETWMLVLIVLYPSIRSKNY